MQSYRAVQRAMDLSRAFLATSFSRARDLEGQRMGCMSQVRGGPQHAACPHGHSTPWTRMLDWHVDLTCIVVPAPDLTASYKQRPVYAEAC